MQRNEAGELGLLASHYPKFDPIYADWLSPQMQRRIAGGRRQPLARAIGLQRGRLPQVFDATGGLGRDAYTLAALGAQVTLVERQHLIVQLLQDAHYKASIKQPEDGAAKRIRIVHGEASKRLVDSDEYFDVVYLDPMYPEHIKSALPSKEMQVLRELTGGDSDAPNLLATALKTGKRVVVKRGRRSTWLGSSRPNVEIKGNQVRFDIYLPSWTPHK